MRANELSVAFAQKTEGKTNLPAVAPHEGERVHSCLAEGHIQPLPRTGVNMAFGQTDSLRFTFLGRCPGYGELRLRRKEAVVRMRHIKKGKREGTL